LRRRKGSCAGVRAPEQAAHHDRQGTIFQQLDVVFVVVVMFLVLTLLHEDKCIFCLHLPCTLSSMSDRD
jgi:hypothetical protein